jgi:hypothetical protein
MDPFGTGPDDGADIGPMLPRLDDRQRDQSSDGKGGFDDCDGIERVV